jgi:hypothetical protein
MYLHIGPLRLIGELQEDFNKVYPFLKLEFFPARPVQRDGAPARHSLPAEKKIAEIQVKPVNGDIEIRDDMKVKDLEITFDKQFNLNVQVFRKSGNVWLETTMTDNWTLQQQNMHGREISS